MTTVTSKNIKKCESLEGEECQIRGNTYEGSTLVAYLQNIEGFEMKLENNEIKP